MAEVDDHVEVRGCKAKLIAQPLFPKGWRCRFPDRLARAHARDRGLYEAHCLSIYPEWVHIWNESPRNPPYPHWDARGGKRMYGPDYAYLVVLTPLPVDAEIDWQVQPLQAPGVEGVTILSRDRADTVVFKRFGGPYSLGEVVSDAEKVVIREVGGQVRSLAIARGTTLRYKGRVLIAESQPISRAMEL